MENLKAPVDIPRLGQKEKERKGSGVPFYAGSSAGPSGAVLGSSGIRVSATMMQPGLLGSTRIAAALAESLGGAGTFLGGIFASKVGSTLVLGSMVAFGAFVLAGSVKLRTCPPRAALPASGSARRARSDSGTHRRSSGP